MTKTVKDVLIAARAKIEQGWTQGASARDALSNAVAFDDQNATCWCMVGALFAAEPIDDMLRVDARLSLRIHPARVGISRFNDTPGRTKEEVLAVFDKAIAAQ